MSQQLAIRIDQDTKERFYRASRLEGKSASEKMRELIDGYVRKADIATVVDDLWARVQDKFVAQGITDDDVEQMIRAVRSDK
jgi:predicted DNA-binding protein